MKAPACRRFTAWRGRSLLIPPLGGVVEVDAGAGLERIDARQLDPTARLRLIGCVALREVALPEGHPVDVEVERPADAAPLTFLGRIGALSGHIGPWHIEPPTLPEARRYQRGGYIGPAEGAPKETNVRVCLGPGALAAAARGHRGTIRVALGDPEGKVFELADRVEPPALLHIEGCGALESIEVEATATALFVADCTALTYVRGSGAEAHVRSCGTAGDASLEVSGGWREISLERCAHGRIRTETGSLYVAACPGRISSLGGAGLYPGPPEGTSAERRANRGKAPKRLTEDAEWHGEILRDALYASSRERARAVRLLPGCELHSMELLAELGRHLAEGVPIERLWAIRRAVGGRTREELEAAWLADVDLIEAACGSAKRLVVSEGARETGSLGSEREGVWVVRVLARALRERVAARRPPEWIESVLATRLRPDEKESDEPGIGRRRWRRRQPGGFTEHADAVVANLEDTGDAESARRWVDAFLEWTHAAGSGEPGLEFLFRRAAGGDATARRLVADAALSGGDWLPEERAQALRWVLGRMGGGR